MSKNFMVLLAVKTKGISNMAATSLEVFSASLRRSTVEVMEVARPLISAPSSTSMVRGLDISEKGSRARLSPPALALEITPSKRLVISNVALFLRGDELFIKESKSVRLTSITS